MATKPFSFIQNFYNFINNKTCSNPDIKAEAQTFSMPLKSQKIYSWLPIKIQFDNHIKQCAQISVTVSRLFLKQKTWNGFANIMSVFSKKLLNTQRDQTFKRNLRGQNIDLLQNYHTSSKIIRSTQFVTEITKLAKSLQDGDKEALMVVIGDHIINILLEKNDHQITAAYYDSYEGQLYSQYVDENDLNSIDQNTHFLHPYSIFNKNNALIGRVILKNDNGLKKTNMGYIGWTKVSLQNQNPSPTTIDFDSLDLENLVKFLPSQLIFTTRFSAIINKQIWSNFISEHALELHKHFASSQYCLAQIQRCANQYTKILFKDDASFFSNSDFEQSVNQIAAFPNVNVIVAAMPREKSPTLRLDTEEGEICFKEVSFCYETQKAKSNTWVAITPFDTKQTLNPHKYIDAERVFFNALYSDTAPIQGSVSKCISSENREEQRKLANTICSKFQKASQNKFQEKSWGNDNFIDLRTNEAYVEQCLDPQEILLGDQPQTEL